MASIRKRYADRVEAGPRHDDPPVTAPPTSAAKLPDPVADSKPPEMPETTEGPADVAAKEAIALQLRLKEMERAEQLNREAIQQQQPPQAAEPQQPQPQGPTLEQVIAHLPERAKRLYREHPEFATDPEKAAQIQYCHHVAAREVGEQFTDPYFDRMEQMLGMAPATNGQTQQHRPSPAPAAPPRYETPVRQQRSAIPVSAPPTRDVPSMATGRPVGGPVRLTAEQRDAARFSGISEQEYARQLERMNRMKASGEIDDGRR